MATLVPKYQRGDLLEDKNGIYRLVIQSSFWSSTEGEFVYDVDVELGAGQVSQQKMAESKLDTHWVLQNAKVPLQVQPKYKQGYSLYDNASGNLILDIKGPGIWTNGTDFEYPVDINHPNGKIVQSCMSEFDISSLWTLRSAQVIMNGRNSIASANGVPKYQVGEILVWDQGNVGQEYFVESIDVSYNPYQLTYDLTSVHLNRWGVPDRHTGVTEAELDSQFHRKGAPSYKVIVGAPKYGNGDIVRWTRNASEYIIENVTRQGNNQQNISYDLRHRNMGGGIMYNVPESDIDKEFIVVSSATKPVTIQIPPAAINGAPIGTHGNLGQPLPAGQTQQNWANAMFPTSHEEAIRGAIQAVEKANCQHSFKWYYGFSESYEYCTKCDQKKEQ